MTPAEINLAMPRAWGDRELSRFQFRAGLFARIQMVDAIEKARAAA